VGRQKRGALGHGLFGPCVNPSLQAKDKEVYFLCFDRKARVASAQSVTLWQQATTETTPRDHSIVASLHHVYVCVALLAHLVCGELHFQRNAN